MKRKTHKRRRVEFQTPSDEHARIAENQREYINELADRVKAGDSLTDWDREWAAGILRMFAEQIPLEQPGKVGQKPQFDHGDAAMRYALLRTKMTKNAAIDQLAEHYDVSTKAIRRAIDKYGDAALGLLPPGTTLFRQ